jgi:hypothetical protein
MPKDLSQAKQQDFAAPKLYVAQYPLSIPKSNQFPSVTLHPAQVSTEQREQRLAKRREGEEVTFSTNVFLRDGPTLATTFNHVYRIR